jgi:hypothetical protein
VQPNTAYPVPDVTSNDSDPDCDPLTVSLANAPLATTRGASVTVSGKQLQYSVSPGGLTFPAAVGRYTDSFQYTVSDGKGGTATATVTVKCKCSRHGCVT